MKLFKIKKMKNGKMIKNKMILYLNRKLIAKIVNKLPCTVMIFLNYFKKIMKKNKKIKSKIILHLIQILIAKIMNKFLIQINKMNKIKVLINN